MLSEREGVRVVEERGGKKGRREGRGWERGGKG